VNSPSTAAPAVMHPAQALRLVSPVASFLSADSPGPRAVKCHVLGVGCEEQKVADSVVSTVLIPVVDDTTRRDRATKVMPFAPVLIRPSVDVGFRMTWTPDHHVTELADVTDNPGLTRVVEPIRLARSTARRGPRIGEVTFPECGIVLAHPACVMRPTPSSRKTICPVAAFISADSRGHQIQNTEVIR